MKILFAISTLSLGGEQRVLNILTSQFIKEGHDITIVVFGGRSEKSYVFDDEVKIIYTNSNKRKLKNVFRIVKIRECIKSSCCDIVIGFATIPSILCSLATPRGIPVIVCERNDPMIYSWKLMLVRAIAYRMCTGAVFQTKAAAECFTYIHNKAIIPNPLDFDKMPTYYHGERNKRIVNTSRFVTAKNHELLVKAFLNVVKNHPEYSLAFYGDGEEKQRIMQLVETFGISENVEFHPSVANVLEIIRDDAIYVLPSNHEGFPNALAEALALGIPSISTDCRIGGPHDMIVDGENGLLVPVGDEKALSDALNTLISSSYMRQKFSCNSIEIRSLLDAKMIASLWIEYMSKNVE